MRSCGQHWSLCLNSSLPVVVAAAVVAAVVVVVGKKKTMAKWPKRTTANKYTLLPPLLDRHRHLAEIDQKLGKEPVCSCNCCPVTNKVFAFDYLIWPTFAL
jgi:hypothetical protein